MKLLQRWKQTALHNKALVWTSFLVAVGTIFYAGAAVVQICLMKETARQSELQITRLTNATNAAIEKAITAAAVETQRTIKENKDALASALRENDKLITSQISQSQSTLEASVTASHNDLRAYVFGKPSKISEIMAKPYFTQGGLNFGTELEVAVRITNSGRTPALLVTCQALVKIINHSTDEELLRKIADFAAHFESLKATHKPTTFATIVSGGSERAFSTSDSISTDDYKKLVGIGGTGQIDVVIVGTITYQDIFKERFASDFCSVVNRFTRNKDGHIQDKSADDFSLCGQHTGIRAIDEPRQ